MAANPKVIDWETVEREYRAGIISVREIGNQCGCSHTAIVKRAKRLGWKRNLAAAVRLETERRLAEIEVSSKVASGTARATIDAAASRSVEVVRNHRRLIAAQYELIEQVTKTVNDEALAGGGFEPRDVAGLVNACSGALGRLIPLERQAFNIGATGSGEPEIKDKAHIDAIVAAARDA